MGKPKDASSPSLVDLPIDELQLYGRSLGLTLDDAAPRGELLRRIRVHQELLVELDRDALLDIVIWARMPVRRSASKEELAKHISAINRIRFNDLPDRGLKALARLRGLPVQGEESRAEIERRLRRLEGFWARVRRKRRSAVAAWITKLVEPSTAQDDYQFLPEEDTAASLKDTIEEVGVVGGIAQRLRGAADQYVHEKLDEIERRIDRKLDEIDRRLCEWRDQEVRNRLRIVKITLIVAIIVAAISLGYDYLKTEIAQTGAAAQPAAAVDSRSPDR
jgi:hypothetical protein